MSVHSTPATAPSRTRAQVNILGSQYLVSMEGKKHVVGKDRMCHTCHDRCPAVTEVARYLKAGGQRAPDTVPARPPQPATEMPPCPICGAKAARDRGMDHPKHGMGWKCTANGYAHLYLARYGHLKDWFTREGRERHWMFVRSTEDEDLVVQRRLPETEATPARVIPFPQIAA